MAQAQRTVLQIINAIQQELGLPISATVFGNSDQTTVQLLALLQLANEELRDVNDDGWSVLQTEFNLAVNTPLTTTGNTTLNSAVITGIPSTASLSAHNWAVTGTGIPVAARILSVDSATQITMTMEATAAATGVSLVFAQDMYALPSDLGFFSNRTSWDRTNQWELLGPDSSQLDQWHRSGIVTTGPRRHFTTMGPYANQYRLWPPPAEITAPIQLSWVYISNYSVATAGSQTTFTEYFTTDTDQPLLNDRALIMSVKWRFWEQKGLNWTSKRDEYDTYISRLVARDGAGNETLNMVARPNPIFISPANVQDGFFPGPTGPNMS